MKNISIYLFLIAFGITMASCLKDKDYDDGLYGAVRNTEGGKYVSLITGGVQNFAKSSILVSTQATSSKTVEVTVSLDFPGKTTTPQTVKIAIDNSKIAAYNTANSKNFQPTTAVLVKLTATELVIPAGEYYAKTTLEVFQNKLDPAVSYLIPITIVEAPGVALSSNLSTRYFNIIGNPLAGPYTVAGVRYNYSGVIGYTGGPIPQNFVSTANSPSPKTALPVDDKVIAIDYANLGGSGYQYLISLDPSDPKKVLVKSNAALLAALPNVEYLVRTYDPILKQIHILSLYNNGVNDRIINETFTKQ